MERAYPEQLQEPMILEKLLYCASSALVSAVATFSLTRFFQRRKRKPEKQHVLDSSWKARKESSPSKDSERDRQLLIAIARTKELEAQLMEAKEDKEAADDACQDLEERLAVANNSVSQLKHQLGKVKFAHKEVEDSFQALHDEKESALDRVQSLRREKAEAQKAEVESRHQATGLQRTLSSHMNDKKNAERLSKKLENELSQVQASKSRLEVHYKTSLQKLEDKLRQVESDKNKAETELSQHVHQMSSTRQKVQSLGVDHIRLQENFQQCQDRLREVAHRYQAECQRHAETSNGLKQATDRIRELEKELRITREAARHQFKRSGSSNSFESNTTHRSSSK